MTNWAPATDAEIAMRDALRADDQELYFRVLARTELLLPLSSEAIAGRVPMGWGTWASGGRTHVLAFTSTEAFHACLAQHAGSARRVPYHELAQNWPNVEWWLAVDPGLPIEGYLPAWFVGQLARGDARLPSQAGDPRERLARVDQVETMVARARATAAVPLRTFPTPAAEAAARPAVFAPVGPAPVGPAPVGPAPVGPAPVGPAPVGPAPAGAGLAAAPTPAPAAPTPAPAAPAPTASSPAVPAPAVAPGLPDAPALPRRRPSGASSIAASGPSSAIKEAFGHRTSSSRPAAPPDGEEPPPALAPPAPASALAPPVPASPDPAPPPPATDQPEPSFTPANGVETSLVKAAEEGSTDSFLSTLLLARVLLPLPAGARENIRPGDPTFLWRTEIVDDQVYVVLFTSPERMAEFFSSPVTSIEVKFVQLIKAWPGVSWSFAVNPGSPVGAKLPGAQIVALASWAADVGLNADSEEATPAPPPVRPVKEDGRKHTIMQKCIPAGRVDFYLDRGYDRVCGFVHRANEVAHLRTPAELRTALGLGYAGSPFAAADDAVYLLRWPAYRPSLYRIPYGGQTETAMRAMEGWVIQRGPFRGNGFAPGESADVIAEFKVDSVRLPHGAELWRVRADATEELVAVLDADGPTWRRSGES